MRFARGGHAFIDRSLVESYIECVTASADWKTTSVAGLCEDHDKSALVLDQPRRNWRGFSCIAIHNRMRVDQSDRLKQSVSEMALANYD